MTCDSFSLFNFMLLYLLSALSLRLRHSDITLETLILQCSYFGHEVFTKLIP